MSGILLLTPTEFEAERVKLSPGFSELERLISDWTVCGFGPVGSAIGTANAIEKFQPNKILLLGIAGCYRGLEEVGGAQFFSSVWMDGIGFDSEIPSFPQLETIPQSKLSLPLELWCPQHLNRSIGSAESNEAKKSELLTVVNCTSNQGLVRARQARFSKCIAEDMESYAVALAGLSKNVPVAVVRGFSNVAGDRNQSNWKIELAIHSAVRLATEVLNR